MKVEASEIYRERKNEKKTPRTEIHDPEQRNPARLEPDPTRQCALAEQINEDAVLHYVFISFRKVAPAE